MKLVRGLLTAVTAVATYYFVFWVGGALLRTAGIPHWVAMFAAITAAIAAGRFVWRRSAAAPAGLAGSVATGAFVLGAIGFVAGFFGPLVFAPQANQGPLLGIFFTGPAGFLLGGIAGAIYWYVRRKEKQATKASA